MNAICCWCRLAFVVCLFDLILIKRANTPIRAAYRPCKRVHCTSHLNCLHSWHTLFIIPNFVVSVFVCACVCFVLFFGCLPQTPSTSHTCERIYGVDKCSHERWHAGSLCRDSTSGQVQYKRERATSLLCLLYRFVHCACTSHATLIDFLGVYEFCFFFACMCATKLLKDRTHLRLIFPYGV